MTKPGFVAQPECTKFARNIRHHASEDKLLWSERQRINASPKVAAWLPKPERPLDISANSPSAPEQMG
jgi:hypothetical protein